MKAILLCGYRNDEAVPGGDRIDNMIRSLRHLVKDVICVVAGEAADAQLRHCRTIVETELVFDTSDEPNLFSNLRAGLHAVDKEPCLVLPMDAPCPEKGIWHLLRDEILRIGAAPGITGVHFQLQPDAQWYARFPLVLTREGVQALRTLPEVKNLSDTRLNYLQLEIPHDADLAPAAKDL